jgi:ABC-type branched-subunit amino acid transport system ATPase component
MMTSTGPILEMQKVGKNFGGLRAVSDLSFEVCPGELVAIIGPNGAGKTTTLNLVSSVYPVSDGEILFKGRRLNGLPPYRVCSLGIGRTFQDVGLFTNMSVVQNVMVGCQHWSRANLLEVVARLPHARNEERRIFKRSMEKLSMLGLEQKAFAMPASLPLRERKLVGIARALAVEPDLLLLDEPAGGLSIEEIGQLGRFVTSLVREQGMAVLLIEHRMEMVMGFSERIVVMNLGKKIAEGTPAEIQKNEQVIAAYLGRVEDQI